MKYKSKIFFDAEGGSGGGGEGPPPSGDAGFTRGAEAFEPVPKISTGEQPLPEPKPSSGPKGAETEPAVQPKPSEAFDAAKFAKEFGATLGETLKPIVTPKPPEMTPEEARKLLKVWEPDDAWYAQYDNLDTRKDAVLAMRDALMTQADTLAQARMAQIVDALRSEFMPHMQAAIQAENVRRQERFETKYPQLNKPELQPLLEAVTGDLLRQGKKFKSENELFTAVASGVEAVIKVNNPEFKLEIAGNGDGQQPADRGGRQLPVTTPGGGGSTGRREGGGQKPEKARGIAIFDK